MKPLYFLICCATVIACKKPEPNNDPVYFQMIVDKKWQPIDQSAVDSTGHSYSGYWNFQPAYALDDYYVLKSDLSYSVNDNVELQPGASNNLLDTGTWVLKDETITMQSLIGVAPLPFKINSVSDDRAVIEQYDPATKLRTWTTFKPLQ